MYSLIKNIVCCSGVSGREKKVSALIKNEIAPFVDECYTDALGNLIAVKRGSGAKKLLFCAHSDEIGFIVTYIEENGMLRLAPIGGINFVAAAYSEVVFENGTRGVLVPDSGTKADALTADRFYVDIGASTHGEAARRVSVGDCFSLVHHTTKLSANRISGRPLDDRLGCAIMVEVAKRIKNNECDIYFVFSVQEEVGCRGAKPAAFAIAPDVAIAFDVTGTGDTPGAKPMAVKLGGGVAIKVKDMSVICDDDLVSELHALARDKKINHQSEILTYGGTDTSSLQLAGAGCAAGALSIPTRYIHSAVETVDMRDVKACVELAVAYAEAFK